MRQEFAIAKVIMGDKAKTKKGRMCHLLPVSKKGSHACSCDSMNSLSGLTVVLFLNLRPFKLELNASEGLVTL